jgi:hypothetical protein
VISAMSTLTKLALGVMGQLRPKPVRGDAVPKIALPAPGNNGGMPLMEAISKMRPARGFSHKELPMPMLSSLLWAANGVNRTDGGRTAPSAMNAQEIDVNVALPSGAYLYDAAANALQLVAGSDLRRVTGYQDFVDEAALDLVYVADHSRIKLAPVASRESFASAAAGAMGIGEGLQIESEQFAAMVPTHDLGEGLAAWIEQRRPSYRGQ